MPLFAALDFGTLDSRPFRYLRISSRLMISK